MSSGKTCVQWVGQAEAHKKCQCIRFLAGWRLRGSRERQPTCLGCTKTWSLRGAKGHSRPKKAPGNFWRILGTKRGKQNKDLKHEYWAEIAKKKPQRLCSLCSYLWCWVGLHSWFLFFPSHLKKKCDEFNEFNEFSNCQPGPALHKQPTLPTVPAPNQAIVSSLQCVSGPSSWNSKAVPWHCVNKMSLFQSSCPTFCIVSEGNVHWGCQ